MNPKDLLKSFKSAPWKSESEAVAFADTVNMEGGVDSRTIVQMIDNLCNKRLASELRLHIMRCSAFARMAAGVEDKGLFVPYVRALKEGDSRVRAAVVPLLAKVNDYSEHHRLCNLLKSKESEVRHAAVQVLKQVGGKTALHTIDKMMGDKEFPGRAEAIDLIMPIAGPHAVPILATALSAGKPKDQVKALSYLGDTRYMARATTAALKAILPALESENDRVLMQAVLSFSSLCSEEDYFEYIGSFLNSSNPNIVKSAVSGLKRFSSPRVFASLERKLRSGPNLVRMEVLTVLEEIGDDTVLPPLVVALGHKQMSVRNRAGEVLAKLSQSGKLDMARVIIWLLRSRDVNVRRMAVEVARKIRDPEGELWPKLLEFLRDEDWWVRERVMDALVDLAGNQLTPHMVAFLEDEHDVVRRFAVDVLIRLKDPQAIGALVNAAQKNTDWWTREKAIEAIAALKDQRAVPYIIDIMRKDEDVQLVCISALEELSSSSAAPYVLQMLNSKNADIRCAALRCLGSLNAIDNAVAIQPFIADPDPMVSRIARELLMRWNIELSNEYTVSRDEATSFLDRMLRAVADSEADDLVISSGRKPYMKRMGKMIPLSNTVLTHEQVTALLMPHVSLAQMEHMKELNDVDFSYEVKSEGLRFRVNIFQLRGGLGAVFRIIKGEIPELEKLGLPDVVKQFGELKHGLVLLGGPTGSGKSTTLAALINHINTNTDRHVISLEDPIEVIHVSKKGLVNQREVGTHTKSFESALRSTLREDPDVILVGEMRDRTTISFAVSAAETGHLVFGTVHTVSADTSVDRLINVFNPREQIQVRTTLADTLKAVVCQYLLKRIDQPGRVLATEVMLNNEAIANLIRKGKTYQISSVVSTSRDLGMQLMDHQLIDLCRGGIISPEDAYMKAREKKDFEEFVVDESKGTGLRVARTATAASASSANSMQGQPDEKPSGTGGAA